MKCDFDLAFIPDEIDDFEIACQKVANLLDDPEWGWLAPRIAKDKLTWAQIMELVAERL